MNRKCTISVVAGIGLALLLLQTTLALAGNTTVTAVDFARMKDPSNSFVNRILYKFVLPDTLAAARVDRAVLHLPLTVDALVPECALTVVPATEDWVGGGGTLSSPDLLVDDSVVAVYVAELRPGAPGRIDVTSLVKVWASGHLANKGLVIHVFALRFCPR